jgi:hypothetical protein
MADAVFVAVILGFFALCVVYVQALDRMVQGSDDAEAAADVDADEVSKPATAGTDGAGGPAVAEVAR